MSIRQLKYIVSVDGISPTTEIDAGTQRDIEAIEVSFALTNEFWGKLGDIENIRFRFDFYDATGRLLRGDSFKVDGIQELNTKLPFDVTRHGGKISVYLIITQIIDGKTEKEVYTAPARLRLNRLPCGNGCSDGDSFTTLAEAAKNAAKSAEENANSSKADAEKTLLNAQKAEKAAKLFDGSNVFIFDGGEAKPTGDGEIEIENANKTDRVCNPDSEDEEEKKEALLPITSGGVYTANQSLFTKSEAQDLINRFFPVGMVLTFHDDKDHSNHLGLTWELFATGKTLVGLNTDDADFNKIGNTGGEKAHTLTVEEMPSHTHNVEVKYKLDTVTNASGVRHTGSGNITANNEGIKIAESGGNKAHNNLQPYIVTAFWRRVE